MSPHNTLIPTRTPFPNLEPMGLGTPYVEKLTSYLIRLAMQSHIRVSSLVKYYIKPINGIKYTNQVLVPSTKRLANGHGATARAWVTSANRLVGRDDLHLLTLLPWSNAFSPKCQLISQTRRWCAACLAEDHRMRAPVYERLLWSVLYVNICPRHRCLLTARCPTCGHERMPDFPSRQLNGFCSVCGGWLGTTRHALSRPSNEAIPDCQTWTTETFENLLLQPLSTNSALHRAHIVATTDFFCKHIFNGDIIALFQHLGIQTFDIGAWRSGRSYPNAKILLALSYCFQISLRDLLEGKCDLQTDFNIRPLQYQLRAKKIKRRSAREWDEIGNFLQQIIAGQRQVPSLASAAKILGVQPTQLRDYFPEACSEVSRITKTVRAKSREEARAIRDKRLSKYISAQIRDMVRVGQPPTIRNLWALAKTRRLATSSPEDIRRISQIRYAVLHDEPLPCIEPRK